MSSNSTLCRSLRPLLLREREMSKAKSSSLRYMALPVVGSMLAILAGSGVGVRGERRESLKVYLHDTKLYKNASFNTAAQAVPESASMGATIPFGSVYIFDDALTGGPARASPSAGSAQGIYVYTGRSDVSSLWAFTAFVEGRGSISVMGVEFIARAGRWRSLPVVGGTGDFALARGLVNFSTIAFKVPTYFVVSLDFDLLIP